MAISRVLALGFAGLTVAATAGADVLVMEDGRRIRGELVSVNRGTVLFDQQTNGYSRAQRVRVNLVDVERISMRDDDRDDDDDDYGSSRNDGRYGQRDDRHGRPSDDRHGRPSDDGYLGTGTYGGGRGTDYGQRERVVSVNGREAWTNTGIDIREGQTLSFTANGDITWGPGRRDSVAGEANSPYNQRRPIPNRPAGALIGRIGNDTFFIGEEDGAFRARTSGRLYLGVNDDYLNDNNGAFSVRVLYERLLPSVRGCCAAPRTVHTPVISRPSFHLPVPSPTPRTSGPSAAGLVTIKR